MGSTANRPEPHGAAGPDTFARLIGELHELGFERRPTASRPHRSVYGATDSPVTLTVVTEPPDPHVHVRGGHDAPGWHLYWTAATPAPVQLISLYAVLNDDPTAAIHAARAALAADPPTKPSTAAG